MADLQKITITELAAGGAGLGRIEGLVVLIPQTLPQEEVIAEVSPPKNGWSRGILKEIIKPSPIRIRPDCPLFGLCGGCDLLHGNPHEVWPLKAAAALGRLAAGSGLSLELKASPVVDKYRGRVTFHLGKALDGEGLKAGFHPRQGHGVIEPVNCRLIDDKLASLVAPLNQWAEGLPLETRADLSFTKGLGAQEGIFGTINNIGGQPFSQTRLADLETLLAKELNEPIWLYVQPLNKAPLPVNKNAPKWFTAADWPEWNLNLKAGPGGFTQVNPWVNKLLVQEVLSHPGKGPKTKALDLYAGLGNFGLPMARKGWQVTAIEEHPGAVGAARHNAETHRLKNFEIIKGDAQKTLAQLIKKGRFFDLLVLDPPRLGAKDLGPTLARLNPSVIQYISCHPATLSRDVSALASLGYKLKKLTAFDMFPRTHHVEALAILERF